MSKTVYEVEELWFTVDEDGDHTQLAKDAHWTTTDPEDFNLHTWYDLAKIGEDCYYRDGNLVTIYHYVDENEAE